MTITIYDRVQETTTTTGTGDLALLVAAALAIQAMLLQSLGRQLHGQIQLRLLQSVINSPMVI